MAQARRGVEPDPSTAPDQAEFRARLRDLQRWAGYTSLQQLEAGASRRGTNMPVSTANRALNNDRLPTADFVERIATACGADVERWTAARDALADRRYARGGVGEEQAPAETGAGNRAVGASDVCPYPGLASFGSEQRRWFFGREQVTAAVLGLLTERSAGTGPLMVVGPSGSGKSSLLRAGLLPGLAAGRLPGSRDWTQLVLTPTADPVGELACRLAGRTHADPQVVSALLSGGSGVADVVRELSGTDPPAGTVVVVDQFEEVFTLCTDERRRQIFVRALCAPADRSPLVLVVIGMRADFHGRCAAHPELVATLRHGHVLLGAMTGAEVRDAVEKPARAVGLGLEPGLVEVMLADLGVGEAVTGESAYQPGALPLLAHALLGTWQQRDGRVLTLAGYRLTGGITGAIATTAERAYQRLDPDQQEICRTVLLRMVALGDGAEDTRRSVDRARLVAESTDPAGAEAVLDELVRARLVTTHPLTVEIVHEALLRAWPRLRAWVENDRAGLLLEQRFSHAAEAWDRDGCHDCDLYRGPRLAAVRERVDPVGTSLTARFLHAAVEHELAEERGVLRRVRRLRRLVAVLACLALLAVAATASAVLARNDLQRQLAAGTSREVASAAIALRAAQPGLAAQLALAAYRIEDTAEARGAMMSALVNLDPGRRSDSDSIDAVQSVAFSPHGDLLVAASRDKVARVWRIGTAPSLADPPITYLPHPGQVRSAVFDPTGRMLATSGSDGLVRLWPVARLGMEDQPVTLQGAERDRGPLAFSGDGTVLATGAPIGTNVRLWNMIDPTHPVMTVEFPAHALDVSAVALRQDGRVLATAGLDGRSKLWDVTDPARPAELATLDRDGGFVRAVTFSPDGRLLASGNDDTAARIWDIENPRQAHLTSVLAGHLGPVTAVAWSPDGTTVATASIDTTARLWDVSNPAHAFALAAPLAGDADNVYSVAFHPDGHTLATSSHGLTVRLWETDVQRAAAEICTSAAPTITPEEWARYLPGQAYAPPCPGVTGVHLAGQVDRTPPRSTQLVAGHSGKCVAVRHGAVAAGAPAYQFPCKGAAAVWSLDRDAGTAPDPEGQVYRLRNAETAMCLDSTDSERKVGDASVVVQRPCVENSRSQLWRFEVVTELPDATDGHFVNVAYGGDCLDVDSRSVVDGAHVVRWPCGGTGETNQVFRVSDDALGR